MKFAEQTQVPLKEHTLDHPSPVFGTLNGYQWLIYIPFHTIRHNKQIAAVKADADFQTHSPQSAMDFPAGSTWLAFTDQVSHAATAGQYQLEQTFLLPLAAMVDDRRSPLRILERLKGRRLA